MPNLADIYQRIFLDFIPVRIIVPCPERLFRYGIRIFDIFLGQLFGKYISSTYTALAPPALIVLKARAYLL